jgi:hypothetical protein
MNGITTRISIRNSEAKTLLRPLDENIGCPLLSGKSPDKISLVPPTR